MINPDYTIGIPTINRADLLNPTLEKYLIDFPNTQILIVDNGNQKLIEHPRITIHNPGKNWGVARSWNFLCRQTFNVVGAKYCLLLNDDIYMGKWERDIYKLIEDYKSEPLPMNTTTWCSFLMPQTTFENIGPFDEIFYPAYFEDNDYSYRLKLQGLSHCPTVGLQPLLYRNSQSSARDAGLRKRFEDNHQKFIEKWGGEPGKERYKYPKNNKAEPYYTLVD